MRIVCDLDGVVFDWDGSARELLAFHRKVEVPPSEHWDWVQEHIDPDDWDWLWGDGVAKGLFRNKAPYPGAQKGVERLSQLGHVAIATSRPHSACRDTLYWLSIYLNVSEVHILNGQSKSSIPGDVYIDDSPHVIEDLRQRVDAPLLLFDRPWNQDVLTGERVIRARGWEEVVSHVSALV